MALYNAIDTSLSGLEANGQHLSLVSDNIVNANTTGFKSTRGEFQDFVLQHLIAGPNQDVGRGVNMAGTTTSFHQGSINHTERNTDVAINGNGFFVLDGGKGRSFTRDGSFRFDRQGWLTTLNGERVQAYQAGADGSISGKVSDIRVPQDSLPARPSNRVQVHMNLDSRANVYDKFDLDHPQETAQFSTASSVYDSLGNQHSVGMYFNKVDDGTWEWVAMADGAEMDKGDPGEQVQVARGLLVFDEVGRLEYSDQYLTNTSFAGGAKPNQELQFDFGDAIDDDGTGVKGSTQYGAKSSVFRNVQDGFGSGTLLDMDIDAEGIVSGVYSNGFSRPLGQLAIARFEATERLGRVGQNQFKETTNSGAALLGKSNANGRGQVVTRSLERSNVDLASEFMEMLRAQRGFQASARSINTANNMLDEIVALAPTR